MNAPLPSFYSNTIK